MAPRRAARRTRSSWTARGNVYINGADFNFAGRGANQAGLHQAGHAGRRNCARSRTTSSTPTAWSSRPDGRTLIISESFAGRLTAFDIDANGGLSERRVFAEGLGPDGICMDAEGAVWVSIGGFSVVRVAEGGTVLQRIELAENRAPFALMLGGADRRTLFICTAEWHPDDNLLANLERLTTGPRTGQILAVPVEVPGTGRP